MKQVKIPVKVRQETGNNTAKRCRKSGGIPSVIYGESGSQPLVVNKADFSKVEKSVVGKAVLLELDFGDGKEGNYAVIKEIDRNPISDDIMHIDFLEVVRGKPMHAVIPFRVFGEADGVRNGGGVVEVYHREVKVICRPRDLPEEIAVDITDLKLDQAITVADLPKLEGVEYNEHKDRVLVSCFINKEEEEEEPAPAAAEGDAAAAPAADAKAAAPAADAKAAPKK